MEAMPSLDRPNLAAKTGSTQTKWGPARLATAFLALVQALQRARKAEREGLTSDEEPQTSATNASQTPHAKGSKPDLVQQGEWVEQ